MFQSDDGWNGKIAIHRRQHWKWGYLLLTAPCPAPSRSVLFHPIPESDWLEPSSHHHVLSHDSTWAWSTACPTLTLPASVPWSFVGGRQGRTGNGEEKETITVARKWQINGTMVANRALLARVLAKRTCTGRDRLLFSLASGSGGLQDDIARICGMKEPVNLCRQVRKGHWESWW